MPEQRYIRESVVVGEQPDLGTVKYCAYNRTRECFITANIEAGDFAAGLDARLRNLAPGAAAALWIVPFRGISPTSVRVPIDLLYLNENHVVLEAVDSFPLSMPSSSGPSAASVLALPANTIAQAKTQAGDQLLLSLPVEMKRQLQQLPARVEHAAESDSATGTETTTRGPGGRVLQWIKPSRSKPQSEASHLQAAPAAPVPATLPEPAPQHSAPSPTPAKRGSFRTWLQTLLPATPSEPRKAERTAVPGLSAYFFTGTSRAGHAVRDISSTGLYVFTEERWYPGTIIRMTLTHVGPTGAELSIAIHAFAVRWGNDGVGLELVFPDVKNSRVGATISADALMGGASKTQLELFLQHVGDAR